MLQIIIILMNTSVYKNNKTFIRNAQRYTFIQYLHIKTYDFLTIKSLTCSVLYN